LLHQNSSKLLNNCESDITGLLPQIRNATRAMILRNGHILLLRKEYDDGRIQYAFPGGGQEAGETLIQALNRECMEEIGTEVEVKNLLHVADYFKQANSVPTKSRHLVEFFFECTVPECYSPRNGHRPDKHQAAVVWKDITQLDQTDLFLQTLVSCLDKAKQSGEPVYLGKFG